MYPQGAPCAAGFRRPFLFCQPQAPILRRSPTPRNNSGKKESYPAQGRKPLLYVIIYQNRPCYKSSAPQGGFFAKCSFFAYSCEFFHSSLGKAPKIREENFSQTIVQFLQIQDFQRKTRQIPAVRVLFFSLRACNYSSAPFFISYKCRIMKRQHNRKELALWAKIKSNSLSAAPPAA